MHVYFAAQSRMWEDLAKQACRRAARCQYDSTITDLLAIAMECLFKATLARNGK